VGRSMKGSRISGVLKLGPAVVFVVGAFPVLAGGEGPWWPQFHGPRRDNVSAAKGLLKKWPEGGPRMIWKYEDCGGGYAGVSIADARIYTSGDFGDREMVLALDLGGKEVWKSPNGRSWPGPYPGARTTPTYENGVLYHMNPHGRLAAYRADGGEEIWSVDLAKRYGARPGRWALSENVILDGNAVLCAPGGARGRVVALEKATGKGTWANTDIADGPAYCSPIVVTHNGVRQMITIMQKSIVSVDVRTGRSLWRHGHETKHDQNVTMPIFRDGYVYATSGHGTGGRLLKVAPDSRSVTEIWLNRDMDNCHGGVLLLGGHFYGSGCRLYRKGLVCVERKSGRTVWNTRALGKVSLAWADGMLYCLDDRGRMSLLEASPEGSRVVGRFDLPKPKAGSRLSLSHPVVCAGRLYVRYWNQLLAYDIAAGQRD
jgi:outer membrane protein assembly factor BamB